MHIFVINTGSSTIKYKLFEMPSARVLCSGMVDRIGRDDSVVTYKNSSAGETLERKGKIADHRQGLIEITGLLTDAKIGVLQSPSEISIVGHRVVHGGSQFSKTTFVSEEVKQAIKNLFEMAPLHNPKNLLGIEIAEQIFPTAKQIVVFDTSFHQSMPEYAYRYAIDEKYFNENQIRAYGFHGTSHKYVSEEVAKWLAKENSKIITAHLGNGCSICAVDAGQSIDTSMGFAPMNGLVMGTRAGDIDQSVIFYMINSLGFSAEQVSHILNHDSGMLALSGFSDLREVRKAMQQGDQKAELAYKIYTYRIKKYIGAYAAALNGLDALVFTGGVGENDSLTREMSTSGLEFMGIQLDPALNNSKITGDIEIISSKDSVVKVLVVKTEEELEIAKQCQQLFNML